MRKKEATVHERTKIRISNMQIDMLSGIIAGIISNLISHPLDTLKVRLQLNRGGALKLWPTMKEMYKYEGVSD